ncbi:MAG: 6-phosphofructokinase [Oscillospiraceae bacterium]|nr:6-phosphofructokinase [Oscillospiraceae bacterium]
MKNLLLAQSGGPTAAINATVAGAVAYALKCDKIDKVYAGCNGIKGIIEGRLVEIGERLRDNEQMHLLETTPASALGSCRMKLKEDDKETFEKIVSVFREYNIGYFVYTGGNDSMDTVLKLSRYFEKEGIEDIKVMGAPKTIDNDLPETDHTPGFGSAAKYIATSFAEIGRDCAVYDIPAVTVVEVMGRNAGWLTASSALARSEGNTAPDLIYLPEVAFNINRFIDDIKAKLGSKPAIVVAVSEGIKTADGKYAAESYQSGAVDAFGHKYLAGTAKFLTDIIKERIGCKVRAIELNLMQRCAAHIASNTDIEESKALGAAAAQKAVEGVSGQMTAIRRLAGETYKTEIYSVDIALVANEEKVVPREWINAAGNDVMLECVSYIKPLIMGETAPIYENGIPKHFIL